MFYIGFLNSSPKCLTLWHNEKGRKGKERNKAEPSARAKNHIEMDLSDDEIGPRDEYGPPESMQFNVMDP